MNRLEKFPSDELERKIKQEGLPKFNSDISQFSGKSAEQIYEWAKKQKTNINLNISNANEEERTNFLRANMMLLADEKGAMKLFSEGEKLNQLSGDITLEIIEKPAHFRAYIKDILKAEKKGEKVMQFEYGEFILDEKRLTSFNEHHFWKNIGLENPNDPRRQQVIELLASITSEEDFINVADKVIDICGDHPEMEREETRKLIGLAFMSNFVRGHLYNIINPEKTAYRPRKMAIETSESLNPTNGYWESEVDENLSFHPSKKELVEARYTRVGLIDIAALRGNEAYDEKIPDFIAQNKPIEERIRQALFVYKNGNDIWIKEAN